MVYHFVLVRDGQGRLRNDGGWGGGSIRACRSGKTRDFTLGKMDQYLRYLEMDLNG